LTDPLNKPNHIAGMKPRVFLETERLRLRSWQRDDEEHFVQMNENPEVRRFYPGILSRKESIQEISRLQKSMDLQGYGLFAAEIKDSGELIGYVGFSHPKFEAFFTPCVEIGWRLDHKFWKKGYATEAATQCLKTGFEQYGFKEIHSFTSVLNTPSIQVMTRIGMRKLGGFNHPSLDLSHPLSEHVVFRISNPKSIAP
jgi:[ribosomal protein S5]-alanine N-acetyltransferase